MSGRMVKCRYAHCKHPQDLMPSDEMVRGNGKSSLYYHKECAHERDVINQIIEYYQGKVDSRVTNVQLRNVINNIIFKKNVPADELLFELMYVHSHGENINSPYSLHYIVNNKKVQNEYKKHKESLTPKIDISTVPIADEVKFEVKKNNRGFGGIF